MKEKCDQTAPYWGAVVLQRSRDLQTSFSRCKTTCLFGTDSNKRPIIVTVVQKWFFPLKIAKLFISFHRMQPYSYCSSVFWYTVGVTHSNFSGRLCGYTLISMVMTAALTIISPSSRGQHQIRLCVSRSCRWDHSLCVSFPVKLFFFFFFNLCFIALPQAGGSLATHTHTHTHK